MKRIFIYTILVSVVFCMNACSTSKQSSASNKKTDSKEEPGGIILKTGQKITVTNSSSSLTSLQMGMEMKNSNSATNILSVISADDKQYSISSTLTKCSIEMSMLGQETSYDSENPDDKDNDIGKAISAKLNVPDTVSIDRMTGLVNEHKKESPEKDEKKEDVNPLAGIMDAMGGSNKDLALEAAFFIIPKDKKVGDSWTDSSSTDKMKTVKTYTIKSIDNNVATIQLKGNVRGSGVSEMEGTEVSFTIETKITGDMIVNAKTSLVSKIATESDVTMTMDVMGQSMPISSKVNSTVTYLY